jgi:hypothetical protein
LVVQRLNNRTGYWGARNYRVAFRLENSHSSSLDLVAQNIHFQEVVEAVWNPSIRRECTDTLQWLSWHPFIFGHEERKGTAQERRSIRWKDKIDKEEEKFLFATGSKEPEEYRVLVLQTFRWMAILSAELHVEQFACRELITEGGEHSARRPLGEYHAQGLSAYHEHA